MSRETGTVWISGQFEILGGLGLVLLWFTRRVMFCERRADTFSEFLGRLAFPRVEIAQQRDRAAKS
jgi:hypothetical protein